MNTLKPFDLEAALGGEPVVNGAGEDVVDVHVFPSRPDHVYGVCRGFVHAWFKPGGEQWNCSDMADGGLYMKSKEKEGYVIIENGHAWPGIFGDEKDAKACAASQINICYVGKVTWEE